MRNCLWAGEGEEKATAGGSASCAFPAPAIKRVSSMQMKDLIRQQSRSQVEVLG